MKKFSVMFFALILAIFCISCGSTTSKGDTDCDVDEDCGDTTADTTPGGDTDSDTGDTTPGGDTDTDSPDPTNPTDDPTNPTDDPAEPAANGIITKIQKGEIAEKTEVTVPECVVTAILYATDNETHENTAIKGVYVSELLKKAQPYSGIYVFIKETAALDEYAIGDKLEVKGTYTEYYESSQIEAAV